jgi:diguanylate cyclase (GGDEF)-like protein/PAS domain S-box-containing protein
MRTRTEALIAANPRSVIVVMIVLANFVLAMMAYSWLATSKERMHQDAARDARNIGRILELSVTSTFRNVDLALLSITSEITRCPKIGSSACRPVQDIFRDHSVGLQESQAFFIADAEGQVFAGYSEVIPMTGKLPNVSDREYFKRIKQNPVNTMVIGQPNLGRVSGRWVINLVRPILQDGKTLSGVVIASVDLESLQKPLLAVDLGPHGAVSLRDSEMGVLLRVPEPKGIGANIGAKNISPQLKAMLEKKMTSGSYLAVTPLDGIERAVAFTKSSAYPMFINVGLSAEDYLAQWRDERRLAISGVVLLILLSCLAGWIFWRIYRQKLNEIQHREAAEAALRGSEELFRTLVQGAPLGISLIEPDGRITYHNPAYTRILGYTLVDVPDSENWWQRAYPDPAYRAEVFAVWNSEVIESTVSEGKIANRMFVVRAKDGRDIDIEFTVTRLSDQRIIVTYEDKTESNQQAEIYRSILKTANDGYWLVSGDGRLLEVNEAACQMLGYNQTEMQALSVFEIDAVTPEQAILRIMAEVREQNYRQIQTRHRRKDGDEIDVELSVTHLPAHDLFCTFVRDITARKRAQEDLQLAASVFANSQEGIIVTDADLRIVDVNRAFTRLTGYSKADVLGRIPRLLNSGKQDAAFYAKMWAAINTNGAWQGEVWNRTKSGEVVAELLSIDRILAPTGEVSHYVAVFSDISLMKNQEAELHRIAHYDPLTGVPNRRLLSDRLDQAVARAKRSDILLAVCYLDLDGFKPINDRFGHATGDQVLIQTTRRIEQIIRGDDTVARLGGDEFVILLNDLVDHEECSIALDRIGAAIAEPMTIDGIELMVSASIGIALFPEDDTDAETLLRHADQAMYQAKEAGRNRYQFFNPLKHD